VIRLNLFFYIFKDRVGIFVNENTKQRANIMSIWRVKECCSLGDMATPNSNQMAGFVAVEMKEKTLARPIKFELVWSNEGGKGEKFAVWEPICPEGYIALGHVTTTTTAKYKSPPSVSDSSIRCVNVDIVEEGKFTSIWEDKHLDSTMKGSVWVAEASSSAGKGVNAMRAVNGYNSPSNPYVLKSSQVEIRTGKLIDKIVIRDLVYEFNKTKSLGKEPTETIYGTTYVNNCG